MSQYLNVPGTYSNGPVSQYGGQAAYYPAQTYQPNTTQYYTQQPTQYYAQQTPANYQYAAPPYPPPSPSPSPTPTTTTTWAGWSNTVCEGERAPSNRPYGTTSYKQEQHGSSCCVIF